MAETILIPLYHAQYKAIHNLHMGRKATDTIPESETAAFDALTNNYPVIYEYMRNKFPERFPEGKVVHFKAKKNMRDNEGTGPTLAIISTITTNYLGERAKVENVLPKTEELPVPPAPEARREVSETGAVSGVPLGAGGGPVREVETVVPLVETDTGSVASPVEKITVYIAVNPKWYDYDVVSVGGTVMGMRQRTSPRAEPQSQEYLDRAAKESWDFVRRWKDAISTFKQYTFGKQTFPSVAEYPTVGKDLKSYMAEYYGATTDALYNTIIGQELFYFSEKLRESNKENYEKYKAAIDDYSKKRTKLIPISGLYYEKLKSFDYTISKLRDLTPEELAENERRASLMSQLEASKRDKIDPFVEKERAKLLRLVEKAAARVIEKYQVVGLNDIPPEGVWPLTLYKRKEDGKVYSARVQNIVQFQAAKAKGFSKERPE
jgi:hypothetical protein